VARHSKRATTIPIHIAGDVAPVPPWIANVSQRKAPGAMSAIAFIVRPVKPRVGFISGPVFSAIVNFLLKMIFRDPTGVRRRDGHVRFSIQCLESFVK
jgi:hypothetical protein